MVDQETRPAIIKQRREALGLTQAELAHLMGLASFVAVNRHENGARAVSNTTWLAYCHILGLDASTGDFKGKAI